MSETQYRIEYTIIRSGTGFQEDDGIEIGFGAAQSDAIDGALHDIDSDIQNRMWETEPGMPDPETVDREDCLREVSDDY